MPLRNHAMSPSSNPLEKEGGSRGQQRGEWEVVTGGTGEEEAVKEVGVESNSKRTQN